MSARIAAQRIDRSDPAVARWVAECGLAAHAVSLRLIGPDEADVKLQVDRLKIAFGPLLAVTRIQATQNGREYVAYGTLLA